MTFFCQTFSAEYDVATSVTVISKLISPKKNPGKILHLDFCYNLVKPEVLKWWYVDLSKANKIL